MTKDRYFFFVEKYFKKCRITWSNQTDDCVNSSKIVQKFQHLKSSLVNRGSIVVLDNYELLNRLGMLPSVKSKKIRKK